jgi:ribosome-associated protein
MMSRKKSEAQVLAENITKAIADKKGKNIITLDLRKIGNAVTSFFVICHGTSRPQVEAIADGISDLTVKKLGTKPWHKEGQENAEWILLDYIDVVVHIFREDKREFYQLEKLWADAKRSEYAYQE